MVNRKNASKLGMHFAGAASLAVAVITLSRAIGLDGDFAAIGKIVLQSIIWVLIGLPTQSLLAMLAVKYSDDSVPLWLSSALGCILAAIPSTALLMVVQWNATIGPAGSDPLRSAIPLKDWMQNAYLPGVALHASLGTILWLTLCYPWCKRDLFLSKTRDDIAPDTRPSLVRSATQPPSNDMPPFLKKLSPKNAGELWALTSEKHYVRVVTSRGEELMLMRLSDAIEECRHLDGLQVHRSHWVHRIGVARLNKSRAKLEVELRNGSRVPVSRRYQGDVVAFFTIIEEGSNR